MGAKPHVTEKEGSYSRSQRLWVPLGPLQAGVREVPVIWSLPGSVDGRELVYTGEGPPLEAEAVTVSSLAPSL